MGLTCCSLCWSPGANFRGLTTSAERDCLQSAEAMHTWTTSFQFCSRSMSFCTNSCAVCWLGALIDRRIPSLRLSASALPSLSAWTTFAATPLGIWVLKKTMSASLLGPFCTARSIWGLSSAFCVFMGNSSPQAAHIQPEDRCAEKNSPMSTSWCGSFSNFNQRCRCSCVSAPNGVRRNCPAPSRTNHPCSPTGT